MALGIRAYNHAARRIHAEVSLRADIRDALRVIYIKFRESGGEWPTFDDFHRHVTRYWQPDTDAARVVRIIPERLLNPLSSISEYPDPEEKLVLTIAGVKYCWGRRCDDVINFTAAVRWMAEKLEHYDPPRGESSRTMPFTAEQLTAELSLPVSADPNSISRLIALLKAERLVRGDGYSR
jgi:hypothetical protein